MAQTLITQEDSPTGEGEGEAKVEQELKENSMGEVWGAVNQLTPPIITHVGSSPQPVLLLHHWFLGFS